MITDVREGFREATRFFIDIVARIPADKWDVPCLGTWSVREVAGHTAHTFGSLADYASPARTAERVAIDNVADFYVSIVDPALDADRERLAQQRAYQLIDDPPAVTGGMTDGALAMLAEAPDDHPTRSIVVVVRFIDWLATRVVELTVHSLDLARTAGRPTSPWPAPAVARCPMASP